MSSDLIDFVFGSYEHAIDVLDSMKQRILDQTYVTVSEYKDFSGQSDRYPVDDEYGWYNLEKVGIQVVNYGLPEAQEFKLVLPNPVKIEKQVKTDMVNQPAHYQSKSGLTTDDVVKAFTEDLVGTEAVNTAHILRYICRWKKKNGLQDLEKAKWYLEDLINYVKEKSNNE